MIGHHAAPGPCQGQAANDIEPTNQSVGGNHGNPSFHFGDTLRTKLKGDCRIVLINPNGMGYSKESFKMTCLHSFLRRYQVDYIGLSETNVDWRTVETKDTVWGRVSEWFESRRPSVAHNMRARRRETSYQAGGTVGLTIDKLANVPSEVGQDPRRLGRWNWILVKGKGSVRTRFITVYCPCRGTKVGRGTFQQQVDYYSSQAMTVNPIKQFWEDLVSDLQRWIAEGDQIVVGGDWNHGISKVNEYLTPLGLKEAVTSAHGLDQAPNTHKRGSKPIDGVYLSSTLHSRRCGYLPFNKGIITDHRAVWVDVPLHSVIGFSKYDTKVPKARRLKLRDPRVVQRYNDFKHNFALEHRLYAKAASILARTTYPLSPGLKAEILAFDDQWTECMIAAENRCRHLHRGVYPWSPRFSQLRDTIKLWAMVRDRLRGVGIHLHSILRIARRANVRVDFSITLPEVLSKLNVAWEEYQEFKTNAPSHRETFLRDLAEAQAEASNTTVASKLRSLIHVEEQRRQTKAIKFVTNKLFGTGTTRVLVPNDDGSGTIEISTQDKLEATLLKDNPKKYHKCEKYCDLMKGQLLHDIGLCGDGPRVDDILEGTYVCPSEATNGTKLFLESMRRVATLDRVKHISSRSSVEEFCRAWKRAKESSSSFGDLHNAHYKSACQHHSLRYLHYTFAEILFNSGFYVDRHRRGIDVMLLKAIDDYRLHRLRTICLLDAELNMNMGRVGDAGLAALIAAGDMADEQYSRPCRSAIDHVVNRQLMFDYFTFLRSPFGLNSCDLAGNYDRIAHAAASLALQRVGVPRSRVTGLFDTLQRMVKKVRTAYGDSTNTYGGNDVPWPYLQRPMGVFQGNRIGPPIWSIISSTVFSILRSEGFGVRFIHALSSELYHLVGFAYVDDTDLVQGGTSAFEVAEDMQQALDMWGEIMNTTGQAMAPEKSWWYLVDFAWKHGDWEYVDGATASDLVATDTNGTKVSLKRLLKSQAQKMLGVFLAPNGDNTSQLQYLKEKASLWADMIRTGHLGPVDTWVALSTGIWKTLLYPLPVTTFTEEQLRSVVRPIVEVALPCMHVNRNTAVAIRYGPKKLAGLGLPHPFYVQGISKIQYLVEHPWRRTPTGNLLRANVEALTLECGVYGALLSKPSSHPLDWTTASASWIGFTWRFMTSKNIRIDNFPTSRLHPMRQFDVALMDGFSATSASTLDLKHLNQCRMYLQVVSLSDISTAHGRHIDQSFLCHGRQRPSPVLRNSFQWPNQGCPSTLAWKKWNSYIVQAFCLDTAYQLRTPLGDLMQPRRICDPAWDWFGIYTPPDMLVSVWHTCGQFWQLYERASQRRTRRILFNPVGARCIVPSFPVDAIIRRINIGRISSSAVHLSGQPGPIVSFLSMPAIREPTSVLTEIISADTFRRYLGKCKESAWLFRKLVLPDDITSLFLDFLNGCIYCVSDGSHMDTVKYGTANWRLESKDRSVVIEGFCITPGEDKLQNSYRSELVGLLGISAFLWVLSEIALHLNFSPDRIWSVIVGCDGYSALDRSLLQQPECLSTRFKHYDLVAAIMGYWRAMPCSAFPVHVRGHQDLVIPHHRLTRMERMNISADHAAKSFLSDCRRQKLPRPQGAFHFGLPQVFYKDILVESELSSTLMNLCTTDDLKGFWQSNLKLSDRTFSRLCWPAFERGMGMLSRTQQVFIMKWLSRRLAVGPVVQQYDPRASAFCPRCRRHRETLEHCLRCQTIRSAVLARLDTFYIQIDEFGTDPDLLDGIKLCTTRWLRGCTTLPEVFLRDLGDRAVRTALCRQYHFGWFHFLQGLHLIDISNVQETYFDAHHPSKSLSYWHSRVLHRLWSFLFDLHSDRKAFLKAQQLELDPTHPAVEAAIEAACAELRAGRAGLPLLYYQYFTITEEEMRTRDVSFLRRWLRTIRIAREAVSYDPTSGDDFSPGGCHRDWLTRF